MSVQTRCAPYSKVHGNSSCYRCTLAWLRRAAVTVRNSFGTVYWDSCSVRLSRLSRRGATPDHRADCAERDDLLPAAALLADGSDLRGASAALGCERLDGTAFLDPQARREPRVSELLALQAGRGDPQGCRQRRGAIPQADAVRRQGERGAPTNRRSSMPLKPCAQPGCAALVRGAARCPKHVAKHAAQDVARRGTATDRGVDHMWRKLRAEHVAASPWCVECLLDGRQTPVQIVHHVVEHRGDDALRLDPMNLVSLCHRHHRLEHARRGLPGYAAPRGRP